jgi:hypothetical protein
MRRFTLSLSLALVVLLSLGVSGLSTHAQDATPDPTAMMAMATHPVVGTWEMTGQITEGDTFPFLAIFHGDGTYMEIYPWGAIFVGVWKPTGERTVEGISVAYEFVDDRLSRGEGRWRGEVDETGKTIDTDGTFVGRFQDDESIDMAVEGPSPGIRLTVLPVVPLSAFVPGGTPVIPADLTDEATPAP